MTPPSNPFKLKLTKTKQSRKTSEIKPLTRSKRLSLWIQRGPAHSPKCSSNLANPTGMMTSPNSKTTTSFDKCSDSDCQKFEAHPLRLVAWWRGSQVLEREQSANF